MVPSAVPDLRVHRANHGSVWMLLGTSSFVGAVDHQKERSGGTHIMQQRGADVGPLGILLSKGIRGSGLSPQDISHAKEEIFDTQEPKAGSHPGGVKRSPGKQVPDTEGYGSTSSTHHGGVGSEKVGMGQQSRSKFRRVDLSQSAGDICDLVGKQSGRSPHVVPLAQEKSAENKPTVRQAISIVKSGRFAAVVSKFKRKYFSQSSEKSRQCKREEVLKLAREVSGLRNPFPLSKDTVEGVAAALKEAGLKSAQQYMVELKLIHVESGYDVEAWLKRTLDLCKKSLERERGPVTRAAEVKVETMTTREPPVGRKVKGAPLSPVKMFLWAAIWMLREIEVRNMKVGHVRIRGEEKAISIFLPTSKCDQQGLGIRRSLNCSCRGPCEFWCPWSLGKDLIVNAKSMGMFANSPLFVDFRRAPTSKSGVIKSWKSSFGERISGHSPRRSGAMFYVRMGLPIQELAFLGRWKSNVVLLYAEEALQERAMMVPGLAEVPPTIAPSNSSVINVDKSPRIQSADKLEPGEDQDRSLVKAFDKPKDLWVVIKGKGWKNRPKHRVTKANWSLPIKSWSTACGWQFANNAAEFYFLCGPQGDKLKCAKCEKLWEARRVREA